MSCATCAAPVVRKFAGSVEVWRHVVEPADGHRAVPKAAA